MNELTIHLMCLVTHETRYLQQHMEQLGKHDELLWFLMQYAKIINNIFQPCKFRRSSEQDLHVADE